MSNVGVTTWGEYLKKKAAGPAEKQVEPAEAEDKAVKKSATKRAGKE